MLATLVGLNMRGSGSTAGVDDMDLEMSEFGQGPSVESASSEDSMAAPTAFENGFGDQPIATADASEWGTSPPRLPPLGLSPMNDADVVPTGGLDRSAMSGPRGAWLTGQIEIEPNGVVPASGFRSNPISRR